MEQKSFVITLDLAQRLLNYLAGRPYGDVFRLVQELASLSEVPVAEPPAPSKKPKE